MQAQLRPVLTLALAAATLISLLIIAQYAWLRLHDTNPLDDVEDDDLRVMMRTATPAQWPILARWVAAYGLGMSIDEAKGVPPGQVRLPNGEVVALSQVISIVTAGQRIDVISGLPLGPPAPALQEAITGLTSASSIRVSPGGSPGMSDDPIWPTLLIRLDQDRVVMLSSPAYALPFTELASVVLAAFGVVGAGSAVFVALFLYLFRRYFAEHSARRLSAPIQRLAAAVRQAAQERDASRRALVEAPAEVAQLAEDFNRMQMHLAETLTARERVINGQRDLVTALSHELRTPLAVLRGHAEVLERAPETASAAGIMLRQIEDLHRLLSDLLDMARLESIEATLVSQRVLLSDVIDEMQERFGAAGWRHGVLVRIAPDSDHSVAARADPRWLRQMVANLLSNAIRHTPQGGLVTLTVQRSGDHALLIVDDTGNGLGSTQTRGELDERGAGVGLGVVRRLAQAMGGTLTLASNELGGTRANLQLQPAEPQRAEPR